MSEYARRKTDGESVYIGTCESLMQIRYEDRLLVSPEPHSLNPATAIDCFWRLPYPDEDQIAIGEYKNSDRGVRLWKTDQTQPPGYTLVDFTDDSVADHPGTIQLTHESGMLVSVTCYHGVKLPTETPETRFFWNGKTHSLELHAIKNTADGVKPIIHCRHCGRVWRYEWSEVLDWIPDEELRRRLAQYA